MNNQGKRISKILALFGVEDISNKITFGGAWDNLLCVAYKIGNIVIFSIEANAEIIVAGTQYTIATFPEGYRPKKTVALSGHATNENYLPQSVLNAWVWTNGGLTARASNGNGTYFFISGAFVI